MDKLTGIELKRARLVPSSMFANPGAVVRSEALSRTQKIEILRRWEFDARPGDTGGSSGPDALPLEGILPLLDQVLGALAALGAQPPARRSTRPTRH